MIKVGDVFLSKKRKGLRIIVTKKAVDGIVRAIGFRHDLPAPRDAALNERSIIRNYELIGRNYKAKEKCS